MRILQGVKKTFSRMSTKTFMGVLVASYKTVMPMCAVLASIYLLAPIQNAVVESVFSHQNLILTNRRFSMVINKVGIKVFIKYCFFLFSDDVIEKILAKATRRWFSKERRLGKRQKI